WSSHERAVPPTHTPPAQVSAVVHALPSSQGAVLAVCAQPLAGRQRSLVQGLWSSHEGAEPPAQGPPGHVSPGVEGLPALQGAVLAAWMQPVVGSQRSSVQTL